MKMENVNRVSWRPESVSNRKIEEFIRINPTVAVIDQTHKNLEELFLLRNPKYKFDKNYEEALTTFQKKYDYADFGSWFYYPWLNSLVRYFPEPLHLELRTGRNKNLITNSEQLRYYYSTTTILGLSVGSHIAVTITMNGGSKHMKLADPDTLSGDNLNRIRLGFQNVGIKKVISSARQIFEINPYADVEIFPDGMQEDNAANLLANSDVIVEEMDNPYWKLKARELARQKKIPVLMGTDNGDGAIIDVERYDIDSSLPVLNGLAGDMTADRMKHVTPKDLPKIAGKIAGANLTVPRMLQSVASVGIDLYSWPQLGTAANMCGSILTYLARRIIISDQNIASGRYSVNLDSIFESDYSRKWFSRKIAFLRFIKEMAKR